MIEETLWQKAASLAARLHRYQLRKDGATPYTAHPYRVALTVRHVFGVDDDAAIAGALLHDVIEDTTADYDEVEEVCGREVAEIVQALTKDMRLPESEREKNYYDTLARSSWKARLVKLADAYDNLCDATTEHLQRKAVNAARKSLSAAGTSEEYPIINEAREHVQRLLDHVSPRI